MHTKLQHMHKSVKKCANLHVQTKHVQILTFLIIFSIFELKIRIFEVYASSILQFAKAFP